MCCTILAISQYTNVENLLSSWLSHILVLNQWHWRRLLNGRLWLHFDAIVLHKYKLTSFPLKSRFNQQPLLVKAALGAPRYCRRQWPLSHQRQEISSISNTRWMSLETLEATQEFCWENCSKYCCATIKKRITVGWWWSKLLHAPVWIVCRSEREANERFVLGVVAAGHLGHS